MQSAGCNKLIKNHLANIFTSIPDLISFLNWDMPQLFEKHQPSDDFEMDNEEQLIFDTIRAEGKPLMDDIVRITDLSPSRVAALLLQMELRNIVRPLPGKAFELNQ